MAYPIPLPTASGLVGPDAPGGFVSICGWAAAETGGFPVTVVLRQGSSTGNVVGSFTLGADGVSTNVYPCPVEVSVQIYAVISGTGTLAGSLLVC